MRAQGRTTKAILSLISSVLSDNPRMIFLSHDYQNTKRRIGIVSGILNSLRLPFTVDKTDTIHINVDDKMRWIRFIHPRTPEHRLHGLDITDFVVDHWAREIGDNRTWRVIGLLGAISRRGHN